jgi:hypothetical protein
MRQAGKFAQRPDHRVERVGDADHEGIGTVGADAFADRLHHLEIDAEQVVAAHARLARNASGDDHHVRARDVGIVVRAGDAGVEALDRAALRKIERLALRHALDHVEQHDIAEALQGGEVGQRAADIAGADKGDFLAGHCEDVLPLFIGTTNTRTKCWRQPPSQAAWHPLHTGR